MMTLAYPIDISRNFERRWQRQVDAARTRARALRADTDNEPRRASCPACQKAAPLTPTTSDYLGGSAVRHHWRCKACGHAWVTSIRVPFSCSADTLPRARGRAGRSASA